LGNYETKISGKAEGDNVSVSFNYRFVLDGLSNIKDSEIIFEINNESSPGILRPVNKEDFLYIIMPIKN
jgi:DNA polymerase-3 subunit beta